MKMMKVELRSFRTQTLGPCLGLAYALLILTAAAASAQRLPGTENGEWRYLGGDAGHTRSSPLDQINATNFADLEVDWIWRTDNFGPNLDYFSRSTPIYVDGMLYTVASPRRQVVAIDPSTGETLWMFREPENHQVLALSQAGLRERGRLRRDRRPRCDLYHVPRLLPLGARCQDRPAPGELGCAGAARWFRADRGCRSGTASPGGLGPVGALGRRTVRRRLRGPEGTGYGHRLGAADRGEWSGCGARGPPAQLRPDPDREHPGRHHGVRRQNGRAPLEVPRDPAAWGVRPRDLGERCLDVVGRHVDVGARVRRPGAGARLPRDERLDGPVLCGSSAGRQPVRRQPARAGRPDGGAEVALPDPQERPVELRPPDAAHAHGSDGERGRESPR